MAKLTYLELPTRDPERDAAFYAAVAGWTIDRRSATDFRFSDDAAQLIGRWTRERDISPNHIVAYYTVPDVAASLERVVPLGGEIASPRTAEGDIWLARVRDPSGNLFGIWQFKLG
jgi:uncharacterized protein